MKPTRPTQAELRSSAQKFILDVIGPDLKILFCGINPGLYSAAIGHHFGRPGNRFWPALHGAGITPRLFSPTEDQDLLQLGYGITNVVARPSAAADELTLEELREGGQILIEKVRFFHPNILAILGVGAYRSAFARPKATTGPQPESISDTRIWVLPNPSGLNAHYQIDEIIGQMKCLKEASGTQ